MSIHLERRESELCYGFSQRKAFPGLSKSEEFKESRTGSFQRAPNPIWPRCFPLWVFICLRHICAEERPKDLVWTRSLASDPLQPLRITELGENDWTGSFLTYLEWILTKLTVGYCDRWQRPNMPFDRSLSIAVPYTKEKEKKQDHMESLEPVTLFLWTNIFKVSLTISSSLFSSVFF